MEIYGFLRHATRHECAHFVLPYPAALPSPIRPSHPFSPSFIKPSPPLLLSPQGKDSSSEPKAHLHFCKQGCRRVSRQLVDSVPICYLVRIAFLRIYRHVILGPIFPFLSFCHSALLPDSIFSWGEWQQVADVVRSSEKETHA